MANPRQRRKARSASTLKPSLNAKRQMRKRLARGPTVHGADILKDNYDPKLTLKQNYARLGLIGSLDVRPDTGGTEKVITASSNAPSATAGSESSSSSSSNKAATSAGEARSAAGSTRKGMARVIRDDAGNIVDIIEAQETEESTPWGAQMATSIADRDDVETFMPAPKSTTDASKNPVVGALEEMAAQAAPVKRHTSSLEHQWLADLVAKYADDTEAMAKDRKLNVWQKTQGEIKRAINKAGGFEAFHRF